jgi:hypothetical protein
MFDALEWSRKILRDASIRSHVLPCPEQGRADGQVLWLLQSRVSRDQPGKAEKTRPRWMWMDTLYSGRGRIIKRAP